MSIGISSTSLCEIFGPDKWPGDRPEHILFCPKDRSSDIVATDFGMYVALTCSLEMPLTCESYDLPAPSTRAISSHMACRSPTSVRRIPTCGRYGPYLLHVGICLTNVGLWHTTAKGFNRALPVLIPDPSRCLTAQQALTHSWLTSFAAPTEHDRSKREL